VKKIFEYLLTVENPFHVDESEFERFYSGGLVIELFGGDALQDPELVESIIQLWIQMSKSTTTRAGKIFASSFEFSISTAGVVFLRDDVRALCEKYQGVLSPSLSIDGSPDTHDKNRILFVETKRGHEGSWRFIDPSLNWFKKTFPDSARRTKWTISPSQYEGLFDSLKFSYFDLGIRDFYAGRIMEDSTLDMPADILSLAKRYSEMIPWLIEHDDAYFMPFSYYFRTQTFETIDSIRQTNPTLSWCSSRNSMCVNIDGTITTCVRYSELGNSQVDSTIGRIDGEIYNKERVDKIVSQGCHVNHELREKNLYYDVISRALGRELTQEEVDETYAINCTKCPLIRSCQCCAAGFFARSAESGKYYRTSSICWYNKLSTIAGIDFWSLVNDPLFPITESMSDAANMLRRQVTSYIELIGRI
jgi:sulfatase maturation enzyme AslB (radical SAM superfamily)